MKKTINQKKAHINMSEETLNIVTSISEIILFITLITLAVYLIISMKKFLKSISAIEKEITEISNELTPVIKDMKLITDDVKGIVDKSRIKFEKIETMSDEFIDKGYGVLNFINRIQNAGNSLVFNKLNLISASLKGFKVIGNQLISRSNNSAKVKSKF